MTKKHFTAASAALLAGLALAGCGGGIDEESTIVEGGSPERGRQAILEYGCTSCHSIPDIDSVDDESVAPDLHGFSERDFIAGHVSNHPEELIEWLQNPQEIAPGTLMPDLGVTEEDARDIAAYLYSQ
ncbi:cytochrome c [Salinibacterium sp. SYSU T00001]|uniref:c-type cytochrome n=1 Tax=Homoserinimonas sedimenticola TaxID=2986805 RepID=UPI002236855F|nr:cytochrome c [Salinibacterium sedimenticola]MCW4384781.1 cytochrome c [Salinibacterium sedimenticola]